MHYNYKTSFVNRAYCHHYTNWRKNSIHVDASEEYACHWLYISFESEWLSEITKKSPEQTTSHPSIQSSMVSSMAMQTLWNYGDFHISKLHSASVVSDDDDDYTTTMSIVNEQNLRVWCQLTSAEQIIVHYNYITISV